MDGWPDRWAGGADRQTGGADGPQTIEVSNSLVTLLLYLIVLTAPT